MDRFQSKSIIVNQRLTEIDIFSIVSDEKIAIINFLRIVKGAINLADNILIKKKLSEQDDEILQLVIEDIRGKYGNLNQEILSNIEMVLWDGQSVNVPSRGDKKKLVELSIKNALYYKKEQITKEKPVSSKDRLLKVIQTELRLKDLPRQIECFDNSNIQGTHPVASMVCFLDGVPSKKNYRHFNIKTVEGPDDFKSMKEVVFRRYSRLINEDQNLPNLIVIDGGKGQLNAAKEALEELGIYGQIPVIGIAKKLEEIYYPEDPLPVHLSKKSEVLMLLQRIRDEAHRFAITFHRNKRSQHNLDSRLDNIKGIGPNTRDKLLRIYKTIDKIRDASITDLASEIGLNKAQIINKALKDEQ